MKLISVLSEVHSRRKRGGGRP